MGSGKTPWRVPGDHSKSRNSQRLVNHGKLHLRHRKTLLKILPAVPDYERRDKRAQRSPPRTRKGNSQSAQRSNGTGSRAVFGQDVIFRRLPHIRGVGRYSIPLTLQPLTHSLTLVQLVAAFGVAPCPSRFSNKTKQFRTFLSILRLIQMSEFQQFALCW